MKYKHKPTEIEAEQWNPSKDSDKDKEGKEKSKDKEGGKPDQAKLDRERILKNVQHSVDGDYVITPKGNPVYLQPGDYIVADHGGYVGVKAGEFEREYEPAEESKEKK
jgi:hypothetical protein